MPGPLLILLAAFLIYLYAFESRTIYQYEKGLRFSRGKLHSVLEPGKYTFYKFTNSVVTIDMRKRVISVPGQEILTSDNICLKLTISAVFEVADPSAAVTSVENYHDYLYSLLHMNIRCITGAQTADELLSKRSEIAGRLLEMTKPQSLEAGVRLIDSQVRDIVFPGELKSVFAKVVAARKDGEALIERARGESAALRNLANSAKLLDENPNLMQLRLIQALGQTSGHTVVLGSMTVPYIASAPKSSAGSEK